MSATSARERSFEVRTPSGETKRFVLDREWVTATGGGYFFAPAISAVSGHLAGEARSAG
jgi:hypothetical protein